MSSITVRNLDDGVKQALRIRASKNQRSMEKEVRELLKEVLLQGKPADTTETTSFAERIQQHFKDLDIDEIPVLERQLARDNGLC